MRSLDDVDGSAEEEYSYTEDGVLESVLPNDYPKQANNLTVEDRK